MKLIVLLVILGGMSCYSIIRVAGLSDERDGRSKHR